MARPDGVLDARERKIELLARECGLFGRSIDHGLLFGDDGFDVRFELVEFLADEALQFGRGGLQPVVGDFSEFAVCGPSR